MSLNAVKRHCVDAAAAIAVVATAAEALCGQGTLGWVGSSPQQRACAPAAACNHEFMILLYFSTLIYLSS
jgi:hypothetical protein